MKDTVPCRNRRKGTDVWLLVILWLILLGGCTWETQSPDNSLKEPQVIRKISASELVDLVQDRKTAVKQGSMFEITGRVVQYREVFNVITMDTERMKAGYPIMVEAELTGSDQNNGKWQSLSEGCMVTVRALFDEYDDNFLITIREGVLMDVYQTDVSRESAVESTSSVSENQTLKSFHFVVSRSTGVFHLDSCSAVKNIKPDNRQHILIKAVNFTKAVEKMKAAGYTVCKKCDGS